MSVIIRLQNLPWSANALDIRNFFRGLSIPEGGVHIVGGELGDAFIAFSTDEDARQAMMLDGGKIKEIQVKLYLSSRSEMHKVIETARQSVPILSLTAPAPVVTAPAPVVVQPPATVAQQQPPVMPTLTAFSAALGNTPLSNFGIPGIGNPHEIPQPAVIEPPVPQVSPPLTTPLTEDERDDEKSERRRSKEKDRRRSRSRSRDRDKKDRKRDRRDRSRSRERRRRDRSRSREKRDRKRDRKDRSRSRSPSRRSRDRRNNDRRSPLIPDKVDIQPDITGPPQPHVFGIAPPAVPAQMQTNPMMQNNPTVQDPSRFNDPSMVDTFNKLQELGKKRNPNAFQGEQQNGGRFQAGRGGMGRGAANFRRDNGRPSRFDDPQTDCCVAVRNAPNHTSYGDVRRFFPYMIDKHGIKMINDNMGRRTGNIYVRFCDSRSKHLALQRRNNELKGAAVTVESLEDAAYEAAVDSFLPYREDNDEEDPSLVIADADENAKAPFSVLKLTDLPHFVKEHDIIKTFSEFSLLSIMVNDCRITRSKIAYVQFVKPEDARIALERKDKYTFGRRHPTLAPITDEEYDKEKAAQSDRAQEAGPAPAEPPPAPEPQGPRDPRQRRQFDAAAAAPGPKPPPVAPYFPGPFGQQQNFGNFPSPQFPPGGFPAPGAIDPRAAAAAAGWASRPPFPPMGAGPTPSAAPIEIEDEPLDCVLMKGLPRDATDRTIVTFLSDTGAVPARIHLMLDAGGLPSGDCFCEFRSSQEARRAASKHGHSLDGFRVTVDLVARAVVEEALEGPKRAGAHSEGLLGAGPPAPFFEAARGAFGARGAFRARGAFDRGGFRGAYRGRGARGERGGRGFERGAGGRGGRGAGRGRGYENGREQRREEESDPALDDFGAPGCVVSMENVPFRATVDDILDFFSEFEISQDDVIRRYNERGQATGDARVAFRTPFDAQRAVKTRHMDAIHERRISLALL